MFREVESGQRRAIELFQSGDGPRPRAGIPRSIQTNAPGVAAVTEPHPPVTGADGTANVALMTLAVPRQSQRAQDAVELALFLTNADQQTRFAAEARVLPSSLEALARVRKALEQQEPATAAERQIRQARLLSASTLIGLGCWCRRYRGSSAGEDPLHPDAAGDVGPGDP